MSDTGSIATGPIATGSTITRAELVEAMIREVGLSRGDSARFLNDLLGVIEENVVAGQAVKLARFGNFSVRSKKERIGRNPKTGKEATITARRVVTFKASALLKEAVIRGNL